MSRTNRFCFTKNNYCDLDVALWSADNTQHFKYWCFGKEVGENGTPHLQGYIEFHNNSKKSIAAAQTYLQGMGLTGLALFAAKGTGLQNITYCSKGGEFFEGGQRPSGQGKRTDLDVVCDEISAGASMAELIEKFPSQVCKFRNGLEFLINAKSPRRFFKTEVWWLWGPTGSGKSRYAWDQNPDAYMKCSTHKWWSGYIGQESVILDDYRPCKEMPFNFILNLFDRYPLSVETKGGMVEFTAKRIYVTSPYSPELMCQHLEWLGTEMKEQLIRRIDHQIQFPQLAMMYSTEMQS